MQKMESSCSLQAKLTKLQESTLTLVYTHGFPVCGCSKMKFLSHIFYLPFFAFHVTFSWDIILWGTYAKHYMCIKIPKCAGQCVGKPNSHLVYQ